MLATSFLNYNNSKNPEENRKNQKEHEEREKKKHTETEIRRLYDQIQSINSRSAISTSDSPKNRNFLHQRLSKHRNHSQKHQNVEIDGTSSSLLTAAVVQAYNNYQLQQYENHQLQQRQNHQQQHQQQQQQCVNENADVSLSENFVAKTQRLSEYLLQRRNLETLNNDQSQNGHLNHKRHINVIFKIKKLKIIL